MNTSPVPPLGPEAADLLAAERGAPSPDDAMQRAIKAKLNASIAAGITPQMRGLEMRRPWWPWAAGGGLTVLLVLLGNLLARQQVEPAPVVAGHHAPENRVVENHALPPLKPVEQAEQPVAAEAAVTPSPPRKNVAPKPRVVLAPVEQLPVTPPPVEEHNTPAPPPVPAEDEALARERRLLENARGALRQARHQDALNVLDTHAQEFPKGQLAEERQALQVLTLHRSGQTLDAQTRARDFVKSYPASLFLPAVQRVLPPGSR
jgi:hypothetical protein